MNRRDLAMVLDCVDALETLASFNCEFGHGRKATGVIAARMENFFEVGLWYSKRRIANAVIKIYEEALRACYDDRTLEFAYGRATLRRSNRRVRQMLAKEQPTWRYQRRRLDQLLDI